MELTPERVRIQFLLATLRFGLNMTYAAWLTKNKEKARWNLDQARNSLHFYERFRPGIAIPLTMHEELSTLATLLATQIIDLRKQLDLL